MEDRPGLVFDRHLYALKMADLSNEMRRRGEMAGRELGKTAGSQLVRIVKVQVAVLRDWLEGIDRICREVWQTQGEELTPRFVRDVLMGEALLLVRAREGTVKEVIERAQRTHLENPRSAQHHLAMELNRFKAEVGRRYEIEAHELGYTKSGAHRAAERQSDRNITLASAAATELRGGGHLGFRQNAIRMPSKPDDFPEDLWPKAVIILSKAIQRFPDQRRLSELCEHLTAEITPLFCEAVKMGKMKPGSVLTDGSGMEELLRLVLVANDPGKSSWGLSDQAWEILQRVKSATWGKIAQAIAEVQDSGRGSDRFKTRLNQPESSRPHTNDKIPCEDESPATLTHSPDYRSVTLRGKTHSQSGRRKWLSASTTLTRTETRTSPSH
jgi:hypothetical protein